MISIQSLTEESCLAIIPARGGSKGLPRKNILPLAGKPLIAHTIEAANAARSVQRVMVSTEDAEIAEVARRFGAEVPFLRPPELAQDGTPTLAVMQHALIQLGAMQAVEPHIVVLLQPTSPLRRAEDIDRAVALLVQTKADSVVSLCATEHHPYWMKRLQNDRVLPFLDNVREPTRRQDLPPVYRLNGAVYVTRRRVLMQENRILGGDTRGIIMDTESSVDIDTPLDLKIAALIMKERQNADV